jgi:hypothetical protein
MNSTGFLAKVILHKTNEFKSFFLGSPSEDFSFEALVSTAGGLADWRTGGLADGRLRLTPMNNFVSLQNQDTTVLCPYKIRLYTRGKWHCLNWAWDSAACDKKRFQPPIII